MKWIKKLTYSKVSSITSIGTGGISNVVHTLANCNKTMINTVIEVLPYIVPFITIIRSEFKEAGITPVVVNIVYIIAMVTFNFITTLLKSNKIAAAAGANLEVAQLTASIIQKQSNILERKNGVSISSLQCKRKHLLIW